MSNELSLRAQLAASEAATCRMREALESIAGTGYLAHKTSAVKAIMISDELVSMARAALAASSSCVHEEEVKRLRTLCGEANQIIQDHVRDCDEVDLQYRLLLAAEGREA